jgi:hypothetical protein
MVQNGPIGPGHTHFLRRYTGKPSPGSGAERCGNGHESSPVNEHAPLIVGAGPVGLALAGDLGWRGVRCAVIDETDGRIEQPKMDLVGVRTMEFCRRWGVAHWVRDAPYPGDYPQDCVFIASLNGFELGRERFPGRAIVEPSWR